MMQAGTKTGRLAQASLHAFQETPPAAAAVKSSEEAVNDASSTVSSDQPVVDRHKNAWGIRVAIFMIAMLPVGMFLVLKSRRMTEGCQEAQTPYSGFAIGALVTYVVLLMSADIVANATSQAHGGHLP